MAIYSRKYVIDFFLKNTYHYAFHSRMSCVSLDRDNEIVIARNRLRQKEKQLDANINQVLIQFRPYKYSVEFLFYDLFLFSYHCQCFFSYSFLSTCIVNTGQYQILKKEVKRLRAGLTNSTNSKIRTCFGPKSASEAGSLEAMQMTLDMENLNLY